MISLRKKQTGFTIVELLIVIVVIGILAAIVITTFTGVQKRARDSERKSDLQALSSQMEVYFADNSKYPTLANMNDSAWRSANLKGLKAEALADPSAPGTQSLAATAPAADSATYTYSYIPLTDADAACDNTTGNECVKYTLEANLENDASPAVNHKVNGSNN